jgi:putative transposase
MPWRETCYMEERARFLGELLAQEESMSELCERYRVSRKTGYKWLERYSSGEGLGDRKSGPRRVPWAITRAQAEAIVGLRHQHPSWGPKKLRARLVALGPEQGWPALSTMGDLLRREGLSQRRRPRRQATPTLSGLCPALGANDVWCVDFKGWFRTGDGARCDPLTATDAFSRYLLGCSVTPPDYGGCRSQFERLFREYGLPRVIRSDNGAPFASLGAGGLSRLSVWWVKLGIKPERIEPGKPQQNGRHERMHKTLKAETAQPPAADLAAQQRRFDRFRAEFNFERPHEALGQSVPALHYASSPRPYPARLEDPPYPAEFELRRVRSNGEIKWQGELLFIAQTLIGEVIGLSEDADGDAELYFGPLRLGTIDGALLKFQPARGGRTLAGAARGATPLALPPPKCEKVLPSLPV